MGSSAQLAGAAVAVLAAAAGCEGLDVVGIRTTAAGDCGFVDAPAFCDEFDLPSPGGRGGEIDDTRWAFARDHRRVRAASRDYRDGVWMETSSNPDGEPTLCGAEFTDLLPPADVRICGGRLEEVLHGEVNAMMIRQPFDFTGRTGTIRFDVDAKRNDGFDGNGWWLEVWITADPGPAPESTADGIGFIVAPRGDAFDTDPQLLQLNSIAGYALYRGGALIREAGFDEVEVPAFAVRDTVLNKFRVTLSRDRIEVWASDVDTPEAPRLVGSTSGLDLGFTVGYVHLQHRHQNPSLVPNCDCGDGTGASCGTLDCAGEPAGIYASSTQVYRWDNVGFDGPIRPPVRAADAADNTVDATMILDGIEFRGIDLGFELATPQALAVDGVELAGAGTATLDFSFASWPGEILRYRVNGQTWRTYEVPALGGPGTRLRAVSVPVPVGELVDGANLVELDAIEAGTGVGNLAISIHPR